jgi:hypothetical protein
MFEQKKICVLIMCLTFLQQAFCGNFSISNRIITKKKVWSQQEFLTYYQLSDGDMTTLTPSIAYGLTQTTGFQIDLPIAVHEKHDGRRVKGLDDMSIFGQWQFYQRPYNLGVFIGGVTLPTRTFKRTPTEVRPQGSYSPELTYIHSSPDFFAQVDIELLITPKRGTINLTYDFFYSLVAGPKIHYNHGELFTLLSLFGVENTRDASLLFFGPLFVYIKDNITVAGALEWPIMQHVNPLITPERIEWILAFLIQINF